MRFPIVTVLLGAACASSAHAQIYRCPDAHGRTVYQQARCSGGKPMQVRPASGLKPIPVPPARSARPDTRSRDGAGAERVSISAVSGAVHVNQ